MSTLALETEIQLQKSNLKHKDAEIKKLKRALRAFLVQKDGQGEHEGSSEPSEEDIDGSEGQQEDDGEQEEDDAEQDGGEHKSLPEPIKIEEYYGSYFCTECRGEVVEGVCFFCFEEHQWPEDDFFQEPASTETQAIHPDRSLAPRGNTPLREIPETVQGPPRQYQESYRHASRSEEYWELLRRGATRLMCETFNLEFTYDNGIYGWADTDLFEEFSGSAMRPGDRWKIHLGRRITLDEDDIDGSAFIEGLLEDAQLFAFQSVEWETLEESSGVWVTRPCPRRATNHSSDEVSEIIDSLKTDEQSANLIKDKALEDIKPGETAIRPNDYSFSDDDCEQDDLEMNDPGYFTTSRPDAVWNLYIDEEDELVDDPEPQASENGANHESEDIDMDASDYDSDIKRGAISIQTKC